MGYAKISWAFTVGSRKLEYGSGMTYAGVPSFFALGLEKSHIPTFSVFHCKVPFKGPSKGPQGDM